MIIALGNGYIGSSQKEKSNPNQEVIPSPPTGWTNGYALYKFAFMNDQDCTVKINNSNPIFLRAGQGFATEPYDKPITSFVIVEGNIDYNWIGAW